LSRSFIVLFDDLPSPYSRTVSDCVIDELRARGEEVNLAEGGKAAEAGPGVPDGEDVFPVVTVTIGSRAAHDDIGVTAPAFVDVRIHAGAPAGDKPDPEEDQMLIMRADTEPAELFTQRVIGELERRGLLPEAEIYTAHEEEEVIGRLQALGYIE